MAWKPFWVDAYYTRISMKEPAGHIEILTRGKQSMLGEINAEVEKAPFNLWIDLLMPFMGMKARLRERSPRWSA
jgi:hypothetical protein